MKFGEKVKALRKEKKLSQPELAKLVGVSVRTIAAYEEGSTYPRNHAVYDKIAAALDVNVNYLYTEDEEFLTTVKERYGHRAEDQAIDILNRTQQLFAGGSLSEDDELAFIHEIQRMYLDSKERAKKFTPKKYLRYEPSDDDN